MNTGISEFSNQQSTFSIYPNPTSSSITVSVSENLLNSTLILSDITGRKISAVKLETLNSKLETSNLPKGVYLLIVTAPNGIKAVMKLVVE